MEEVAFVRRTLLTPEQMARIRDVLLKEYEKNSQDNGYLLRQIARRYAEDDVADVGAVFQVPAQISALSGYAVQLAAQRYLDPENRVQIVLMPEIR